MHLRVRFEGLAVQLVAGATSCVGPSRCAAVLVGAGAAPAYSGQLLLRTRTQGLHCGLHA
jgi:hypothetical protein